MDAGLLYSLAVGTAVLAEFVIPGKLGFGGVLIPIACYTAVTLCLYSILKPVNSRLALLVALSGLVGLAFEAVQRQPWGINIAMVFHGLYCLLIGYLIVRSNFLPRILGVAMAVAGLVWLLYLSPSLANRLSPWNTACGLLGEALPMLWLLVMGVNAQRWKEQSTAAEESQ
jgi:hypothetical protein